MLEGPELADDEMGQERQEVYILKILVRDDPNRPNDRLVMPGGSFPSEVAAMQHFVALRARDSRIDGYQVLKCPADQPMGDEEAL